MRVALAPTEPDACAHLRTPLNQRLADAMARPHRRPRVVPMAANLNERPEVVTVESWSIVQ